MPTQTHQLIIAFFFDVLRVFSAAHAPGIVLFSGIRIKIPSKRKKPQFREPDIVYMKAENAHRRHDVFWEGADLAMEVVSGTPSDRKRDMITKRKEYAAAGIREYWIIDPDEGSILVLTLQGKTYQVHGEFRRGAQADSVLLPGFTVSVDEVLDAGNK